ncbi:hypothetical protein IGI04_040032, partial [Brassica rapa subsp. trilocularis]
FLSSQEGDYDQIQFYLLSNRCLAPLFEEPKLTSNLNQLNLHVLGFGIHWIRFLFQSIYWFMYVLEKYGDLKLFEVHNYTDASDVNQQPIAEVMPVLLKSGQSASRDEAVEEMKDCRSMVHPCHRSTVMPEHGLSIIYEQLKPISHTKLPKYSRTIRNPI